MSEDRESNSESTPKVRPDWKENPSNTIMFLVVVIAPLVLLMLTVFAVFAYLIFS